MVVKFTYIIRSNEPKELIIQKQRATYFDAKELIEIDLKQSNQKINLSQIILIVKGREIKNNDEEIFPETTIKVEIKENYDDKQTNEKKPKTTNVYIEKSDANMIFSSNTKARKQAPKQLPDTYVCKRCGKKGHYIKDCPENNNKFYEKRLFSGVPMEMLEETVASDPNAKQMRVGDKIKYYRLKETHGERMAPTIQNIKTKRIDDDPELPDILKCDYCKKILIGAVKIRCCNKDICEDCHNQIKRHEQCLFCKKDIDIVNDIFPNKGARDRVQEYFRKANDERKRIAIGREQENNEEEEMKMEEEEEMNEIGNMQQQQPIKQIPLDEFFIYDVDQLCRKEQVPENKYVWSLYKTPCPKPFDGMLLFAKRSKTVEEIFEENKALILESAQQMMETENE